MVSNPNAAWARELEEQLEQLRRRCALLEEDNVQLREHNGYLLEENERLRRTNTNMARDLRQMCTSHEVLQETLAVYRKAYSGRPAPGVSTQQMTDDYADHAPSPSRPTPRPSRPTGGMNAGPKRGPAQPSTRPSRPTSKPSRPISPRPAASRPSRPMRQRAPAPSSRSSSRGGATTHRSAPESNSDPTRPTRPGAHAVLSTPANPAKQGPSGAPEPPSSRPTGGRGYVRRTTVPKVRGNSSRPTRPRGQTDASAGGNVRGSMHFVRPSGPNAVANNNNTTERKRSNLPLQRSDGFLPSAFEQQQETPPGGSRLPTMDVHHDDAEHDQTAGSGIVRRRSRSGRRSGQFKPRHTQDLRDATSQRQRTQDHTQQRSQRRPHHNSSNTWDN